MSMALLHGSRAEDVSSRKRINQLQRVKLHLEKRLVMVEMWTETGQVPSEQTTQGQGDERRQQEVGDSVEVERREGHHGDGQGEREAGSHMKEFTGRDAEGS